MKKNIFICCTEQSGENLCFNILSKLDLNNYNVDGVCGARSEKFLRNKFFDISDFKSIGLLEVLISLPKYISMINYLKNIIIQNQYDLVICIDSPDFNYNLVKSLRKKKFNNKIIQIVAPTVWAWRPSRAKNFAKIYNEIFLLFDFEKKYFNYPNLKTLFIGHPIFHIKKKINQDSNRYIAFLPGSRENEINKLFKYFDKIEKYISNNNLQWKIFIPTLPHLLKKIENRTRLWKTKTVITDNIDNFDNYFEYVFISITCSGTASLEVAKRNIPQIVIYKLNYLTELLGNIFVNVKYACLLNIISDKIIIPELVNSNLTEKKLLNLFEKLLINKTYREEQINNVNNKLHLIESKYSPYEISAKRISNLL